MSSASRDPHGFSVELDDREKMKRFFILSGSGNAVLFEGALGELQEIQLVEGVLLEVKGSNGILRLDITEKELRKALPVKCRGLQYCSELGPGSQ